MGILHENIRKFILSRSVLLRTGKVLNKIVDKVKTDFYVQYFFFKSGP